MMQMVRVFTVFLLLCLAGCGGGSAIFFITNDHTGNLHIEDSVIRNNTGGSWYALPGISMHPDTAREIVDSTLL